MALFDEYFTGGCSISLENVSYNKLDEMEADVTLSIKDDLEIKEKVANSNHLELIISRNLSFEPKSLVDITVVFGIELELNQKYMDDAKMDYDEIRKVLLDEDCVITLIVMSRISLLISQLTSSYGERPIVTPPSFMA